ncbi:LPD11 domain-containing protein [Ruminococcus sp.]|uniref:MuF-C-terminal domain-containing protein n=1 Tax=Ruminococcus sp. TaxID=41978 RepID=UPI0025E01102|nr:LPD11 domain-containing protein [Ruminococcus sp.]
MTTYGNEIWNKATDNDDKTIVSLKEKDLKKLCSLLEQAGMNYYAFSRKGTSKLAFNTKDLNWFKQILGSSLADKMLYQKPEKPYTPPKMNIIGNMEYRYIPQKEYFKADRDVILKMASLMEQQNIKFSGRIYTNNKGTITVSAADIDKLKDIKNSIMQMRSQTVLTVSKSDMPEVKKIHKDVVQKRNDFVKHQEQHKEHTYTFIGNKYYDDIAHKEYFSPNISPERYKEIQPYLDELAEYSGLIKDGRVIFTSEQGNTGKLIEALIEAQDKCDLSKEIDNAMAVFIEDSYSKEDILKLKEPIIAYAKASFDDRINDKDGVHSNLMKLKQEIDDNIALQKVYENHNFSDEQKALLRQGYSEGISVTVLDEVDERLLLADIRTFFDMFHSAVAGEIDPSDVQRYLDKAVLEHSKRQDDEIVKSEKTFAEQVDDALNGKLPFYTSLKVCDTPQILLDVGCEQLPMLYTQKHLKNAILPTDEKNHQHGLDVEQVKRLPKLLSSPVMIIDSPNRKDSIIVVTTEIDKADNPIIASIKPNGKGRYEVENISSNFITSVYGRNNFPEYFKRIVQADNLLFCNKQKSQELFERWGEQYSELTNNLDFNTIIHQSHNIVKSGKTIDKQENVSLGETLPPNDLHAAFEKLYENHNFSDQAKQLLERTEKQMKINGYDNLNPKLFRLPVFTNTYGSPSNMNKTLFDGKLKDVIAEVNSYLGIKSEPMKDSIAPTLTNESQSETNRLLGRLKLDCDYYLKTGAEKHLWAETVEKQIAKINELYEKMPENDYFTREQIDDYEKKMLAIKNGEIEKPVPYTTPEKQVPETTDTALPIEKEATPSADNENTTISSTADEQLSLFENSQENAQEEKSETNPPTLSPVDTKLDNDNSDVDDTFAKQLSFDDNIQVSSSENTENNEVQNFAITDDNLGEGGAKTKFKANIAAIETLKILEKENRPATDEEKQTLSKYVGWGGLQNAFDDSKKDWAEEYTQLKELLTDKEYSLARASVLDAFYTTPTIIDGMYEALAKFGFEGGNVLEPSLGVGNFIGRMPQEMTQNTKIYGTEIDSISGRIAQKLYPNAEIKVEGFEKNEYQNGCFDVAIGNVPFGDLSFKDQKHNTNKLHDYFFAEALDKVKPGGIVAFITSTGTLDKKDESIRKQLAEKADLIGAVRLPSGAFRANAGTEVTSDIIFLQKRSAPPKELPDWVHIGENKNGLSVNQYFIDKPEMILGELVKDSNPRSSGTKVIADKDKELGAQLSEAVNKMSATISDNKAVDVYPKLDNGVIIPPQNLRNFSLFEKGGNIYFKTSSRVCEFKYNSKNSQLNRAKAFIEIRDCTRNLLAAQEQDHSDDELKALQGKLNTLYDNFYNKYGLLHSQSNKRYFRDDISYNLVATLEKSYDKDKLLEKSDIFTKRTIKPAIAANHVDTAIEALTLSIAEKAKIDFDYMQELTDLPKEQLIKELKGDIFLVPNTSEEYQTASEYLSGDIRQKLNIAEQYAEKDGRFKENVIALKQAMPEPLKSGDIDVKIGATWIDPKYYEQFIYETFNTPQMNRTDSQTYHFWRKPKPIKVEYSSAANAYSITNKRIDKSVAVTKKFGTDKTNAYEIMESLLNLKDPKVTMLIPDPNNSDKTKRVVDINATKLAQKKAEKIRSTFKDWIFNDPERREKLVAEYNERFNCIRPREYDGSNLRFPSMNADIKLREHQKNAIAHALFGGNTLFAHSVGAGKTFEMIASIMESKRLGLSTKALMCVPNHLTEQIGDDFMKLYPNANILVATKQDFQKNNRQQLFAKIATGNYDAVIIGHSQLKAIPMSQERQENILQQQIDDIVEGIKLYKNNKDTNNFSVKAMERTKRGLEQNLEKLRSKKQDDVITFEEMGIDKLVVDEAHEFKNLFTPTKLQNVSGISSSASQKALDLFTKCRYLDEKTGGKGIILATGTPLSNSVTELHTMMRYLEYDFLKAKDLDHFDNWVSVFGTQKTDWELAPAGNKFKQRTRIAHYTGLPELMSMFKQVADIRTADTMKLDVPECETHIVNVEATDFQKKLVEELADRADDVQAGNVEPTEDNMLKITSDGRKLGLDPRLIDPSFEDSPMTKLNQCVENVFRIHQDTEERKLTQIIFCDLGVPHKQSNLGNTEDDDKSVSEKESFEEECDFCVYDDIKKKLISKGVPETEIAYIHDAKTEKQKTELFDKVRSGEVRVLLGSTSKMGTGTNVQDKLIAVHDLDIPWRPADMEQRKGRIVRQGNQNEKVHLYRYVTKGTFDAYSYQTLESKQKFISQIMTSKTPVRKCDDVDQQALSYSEIKTLCTGDERIKEKMQLDNEVKELNILKAEYTNTKHDMEDKIFRAPAVEQRLKNAIDNYQTDKKHIESLPVDLETQQPVFKITIDDHTYTDRTEAAKAFEKATFDAVTANMDKSIKIGEFQGFPLSVSMDSFSKVIRADLKGAAIYHTDMGISYSNNLKRLENALYSIDEKINNVQVELGKHNFDIAEAKKIVAQPFAQAEELEEKTERLATLTDELNQAAADFKKNNPDKKRTNYFDCAKLKKEAARLRSQERKPKKEKGKGKEENVAI